MAITVYTYNDKVLKNVATDKWLKKPDAPAGFVMNASNAIVTGNAPYAIAWESPSYPDNYDGNGKHYSITNNNSASAEVILQTGLMYANATNSGGPQAIAKTAIGTIGTSTGTMEANGVPANFGKYLTINIGAASNEALMAYLANLTITIVD